MSELFTPKILYKQHGDMDKAIFPYGYIFTSHLNTICSSNGVAATDIAMGTASVRIMFPWLLWNAQGFSVALSLVKMRSSSVNE